MVHPIRFIPEQVYGRTLYESQMGAPIIILWLPVMLLLVSPSVKAQEPIEIVSAQYGTDASAQRHTAAAHRIE